MDNSYQHPPIIITIQGLSVWEGVRSPGSPEQTLWDAPPSRRAAHVRAHPYTPPTAAAGAATTCAHTLPGDIENTDNPRKKPRALTSRQAVGEPHAFTVLCATLLACRHCTMEAQGPLPEKGTWEKG